MVTRIVNGDALAVLRTLESESVQVCITSPPYFALRDYGTATWEGGDAACDHAERQLRRGVNLAQSPASTHGDSKKAASVGWLPYRDVCGKCGGTRIDQQLGLESTPAAFIAALVEVFDEVKRVLRRDGLAFVNLGDSYAGSGKGPTGHNGIGDQEQRQGFTAAPEVRGTSKRPKLDAGLGNLGASSLRGFEGVKPKSLLLIPERFAIAMQDSGWTVRSRIAWCKTSAMPESVRDRPTSAWEHIWMFSKSPRYFYDAEAVRQEPAARTLSETRTPHSAPAGWSGNPNVAGAKGHPMPTGAGGASLRNFWLLGPSPSSLAHYASFPPEIPKRCILAGTSQAGACPACGAPWVRSTTHHYESIPGGSAMGKGNNRVKAGDLDSMAAGRRFENRAARVTETLGWAASCSCVDAGPPVPQTVLDPFAGTFTTLMVADRLGRSGIGIDLSPEYCEIGRKRIESDAGLLFDDEPVTVEAPRQPDLFDALEVVG